MCHVYNEHLLEGVTSDHCRWVILPRLREPPLLPYVRPQFPHLSKKRLVLALNCHCKELAR